MFHVSCQRASRDGVAAYILHCELGRGSKGQALDVLDEVRVSRVVSILSSRQSVASKLYDALTISAIRQPELCALEIEGTQSGGVDIHGRVTHLFP
jgi:hypothetical protein